MKLPVALEAVKALRSPDGWAATISDMTEVVFSLDDDRKLLLLKNAHLEDRERSIIEACERVADGGQYRADIVSAIDTMRKRRDAAERELAEARAQIEALRAELGRARA